MASGAHQTQGGASRLMPLRSALGWFVAAPSGRDGPDASLDIWVTKEHEGLKGEPILRNLFLLCNPDTQSSV